MKDKLPIVLIEDGSNLFQVAVIEREGDCEE